MGFSDCHVQMSGCDHSNVTFQVIGESRALKLDDVWLHIDSQKTQRKGKIQEKGGYLQTTNTCQSNAVFCACVCVYMQLSVDSFVKACESKGVTTQTLI